MENNKPYSKKHVLLIMLVPLVFLIMLVGYSLKSEVKLLFTRGIYTLFSPVDFDGDGIDDYTDMVISAREYINTNPKYVSDYFDTGYPPDGMGVCADVIWRAMKGAGYSLKDMLDKDISENRELYYLPIGKPDPPIDFRRVINLDVFFSRYAISLTTDTTKYNQWQPGDIVVYDHHIAIVSNIRNEEGMPYIIHHGSHGPKEEDALLIKDVLAHYRLPVNWKTQTVRASEAQ